MSIRKSVWIPLGQYRKLRALAYVEEKPLGEVIAELIDEAYQKVKADMPVDSLLNRKEK